MAAALSVESVPGGPPLGGHIRVGTGNLGASYTAGGEAVTKSDVGFDGILSHLSVDPAGGYVFEWDSANSKILAYEQTDPADAGGANVPLVEVTAATDLSAVTFRFLAIGG